jgi:hypothetical protein
MQGCCINGDKDRSVEGVHVCESRGKSSDSPRQGMVAACVVGGLHSTQHSTAQRKQQHSVLQAHCPKCTGLQPALGTPIAAAYELPAAGLEAWCPCVVEDMSL